MDVNGNGKLSHQEFIKALNRLGMGLLDHQIEALVTVVGSSSEDDSIRFETFLQMLGETTHSNAKDGSNVAEGAAAQTSQKKTTKGSWGHLLILFCFDLYYKNQMFCDDAVL